MKKSNVVKRAEEKKVVGIDQEARNMAASNMVTTADIKLRLEALQKQIEADSERFQNDITSIRESLEKFVQNITREVEKKHERILDRSKIW